MWLIEAGVKDKALAFESMPFVVGFYEMQVHRMDAELARLVENYFQGGFRQGAHRQAAIPSGGAGARG